MTIYDSSLQIQGAVVIKRTPSPFPHRFNEAD